MTVAHTVSRRALLTVLASAWICCTSASAAQEPVHRDPKRGFKAQRAAAKDAVALVKGGSYSAADIHDLLADPSAWVRDGVVDALVNDATDEQLGQLLRGLGDRRALVREGLAEVCGRKKVLAAVPLLVKLLGHRENQRSRSIVAWALGMIGSPDASKGLTRAVRQKKSSPLLTGAALRALALCDPAAAQKTARKILDQGKGPRLAAFELVLKSDIDRALGHAAEVLPKVAAATKPWEARFAAGMLRALTEVSTETGSREQWAAVIDALLTATTSSTGRQRSDSFGALRKITGESGLPDDADLWQAWWQQKRDSWKPGNRSGEPEPSRTSVVKFHGLPVDSTQVVFLQDLSGGMSRSLDGAFKKDATTRLDYAKQELTRVLTSLRDKCLVNVVYFASEYYSFAPQPVALGRGRKKLVSFSQQQQIPKKPHANRGNIFDSLIFAMSQPHVDTVYLLTEGAPTEGKYLQYERFLRHYERLQLTYQTRVHVLLLGRANGANRDFLERLAESSGGRFEVVEPNRTPNGGIFEPH